MKTPAIALLAAAALFSLGALAQAPAGPDAGEGSAPSPRGTPAPQQEMQTEPHDDGPRTEGGRRVNSEDGNAQNDGRRDDSAEHSSPGGPTDPGSDPGSLD